MSSRLDALYRRDHGGRITTHNQWDDGDAPRFHLARTRTGNVWRFRADLPAELARALEAWCGAEPPLAEPRQSPSHCAHYDALLNASQPIASIWSGPAFEFPPLPEQSDPGVVAISVTNAGLLEPLLPEWLPDVPHRHPFLAAVVAGQAVAVCASVRMGESVHEAGVETHPDHRRQGHAARVVRAWSRAVQATGTTPIYSTSWQNEASLGVARALGLTLLGVDYHVT
jgi:hypothetical protein